VAQHQGVPEQMPWQKYLRPGCRPGSQSGNNEIIIYQDISTAIAAATYDLPVPCHEQRTVFMGVFKEFRIQFLQNESVPGFLL